MDRQYEGTGTGAYETGHKPLTQTIKEKIPGTEEHRLKEMGVTGTGAGAMGTGAGYTGTGTGTGLTGTGHTGTGYTGTDSAYTGTGAGYTGAGQQGAPIGERVKAAIPGTDNYAATHGATGAHRTVEQAKAYIPGTDEHRIHEANRGVGGTGLTGTGVGHTGVGGTGVGHTGVGHTGVGHTGGVGTMGATDTYGTTGTGTGAGYGVEGEKKSLGQKIKEVIPGTREHEVKKLDEGKI